MSNKQRIFEEIAVKLEFPNYFGYNWDALDECLMDLAWTETSDERTKGNDDCPPTNFILVFIVSEEIDTPH